MSIGKAIKIVRAIKRKTQVVLANETGLPAQYLSLVERDKRDPKFKQVQNIARVLKIPLNVLLVIAGEEDDFSQFDENGEFAEALGIITMKYLQGI